MLNLKEKNLGGEGSRMSNVSSTSRYIGNMGGSDIEIKLEVKKFLTSDKNIKLYILIKLTFLYIEIHLYVRYSDKGEVKKRILTFSENLETIYALKKNGKDIEVKSSMHLKEMESCVRGCATAAFSKAKGFFTKSNY